RAFGLLGDGSAPLLPGAQRALRRSYLRFGRRQAACELVALPVEVADRRLGLTQLLGQSIARRETIPQALVEVVLALGVEGQALFEDFLSGGQCRRCSAVRGEVAILLGEAVAKRGDLAAGRGDQVEGFLKPCPAGRDVGFGLSLAPARPMPEMG